MPKIEREVAVLSAIRQKSPFVPSIKDFGIEPISNTFFIVTEDFGDVNLADFLVTNYSLEDVKKIMICLIKGVLAAHQSGLIHRDIKVQNVILSTEKDARLIDWGLADFHTAGARHNHRVSTKPYKPPELLVQYEHYDYTMDVWSLGMVLACLVS